VGTWIAWSAILLMVALLVALQNIDAGDGSTEGDDDRIGLMLMEMQSRYMVGIARLLNDPAKVYVQAAVLKTGTVAQRQRFVVLAAELAGPEEAGRLVEELDIEIRTTRTMVRSEFQLSDGEEETQSVLRALYSPDDEEIGRIADLSPAQRLTLIDQLGWFGELALAAPDAHDPQAREEALAPASRVALALLIGVGMLMLGGAAGLVGLIVILVLVASGKVRSGLGPSLGYHGVYAETFAIWLALFFVLQLGGQWIAGEGARMNLTISGAGFLLSLTALAWPRLRGVAWRDVRRDVGLTLGRDRSLEPLYGAAGYLMALPPLAVGALMSLVLIMFQGALAKPGEPFSPAGGPAHPIVMELAGPGWTSKLMVLVLAAGIAPLVEETMFRGVLYRHLREASARFGIVLSILVSGTVSGFIFAAIHPQGWVAIPALMALAWMFALMREWRGTLLPSMAMHGISNGVVMFLLLSLLGG
jgi:membrane protease YdiL (CAAX protease family)